MVIKNFLFHRVSDEIDIFWQPMKPATFEMIISFLVKTHRIVSLEEFLSDPLTISNTERKIATILFDDGFKDNIEFAAPILQKYKCPASFYVVTNCIDTGLPTWTYLIDYILQNAEPSFIELPFEYVPAELRTFQLPFRNDRDGTIKKLKPWLKFLSPLRRKEIMDIIISQCKNFVLPQNKMMNWEDIRQLKQAGFRIGSHTHTHPLLAVSLSEQEIEQEMKVSANRITSETGTVPETISYPNGSFNERVTRLARKSGYKWGLAVEERFFRYNPANIMAIPRAQLYEVPWWRIKLKILGIHPAIRRLWQ